MHEHRTCVMRERGWEQQLKLTSSNALSSVARIPNYMPGICFTFAKWQRRRIASLGWLPTLTHQRQTVVGWIDPRTELILNVCKHIICVEVTHIIQFCYLTDRIDEHWACISSLFLSKSSERKSVYPLEMLLPSHSPMPCHKITISSHVLRIVRKP